MSLRQKSKISCCEKFIEFSGREPCLQEPMPCGACLCDCCTSPIPTFRSIRRNSDGVLTTLVSGTCVSQTMDTGFVFKPAEPNQNSMQIRVLFFGMLKDVAGRASDSVSLPEGATVGDLLSHYEDTIPRLKEFLPSFALSFNQEYVGPEVHLRSNDQIRCLPPV